VEKTMLQVWRLLLGQVGCFVRKGLGRYVLAGSVSLSILGTKTKQFLRYCMPLLEDRRPSLAAERADRFFGHTDRHG
jgi:hypothetical protein